MSYKVFRYIKQGVGKSHRALEAEQNGRYPMTTAKRELKSRLAEQGVRVTLEESRQHLERWHDGEWHHTGLYGMRTDYFNVRTTAEKVLEDRRTSPARQS